MLEAAEKHERAFEHLGDDDPAYSLYFDGHRIKRPPDSLDWTNARYFVKFLKLFYQVTLRFSGSLYVTSNSFFYDVVGIHSKLNQLCENENFLLGSIAVSMKLKFDKYWDNLNNINFLLYVAIVLD